MTDVEFLIFIANTKIGNPWTPDIDQENIDRLYSIAISLITAQKEIAALERNNKKLKEEVHATFLGAHDLREEIKKLKKEISDLRLMNQD